MKLFSLSFFISIFLSSFLYSQSKLEGDINTAYQNAKKGVYWALTNISEKKSKLDEDLVADDKLYAKVKLEKVIDGVKIESKGFNNSNEVNIIIYKSNETLLKEGYLKTEGETLQEEKKKK